MVQTRRVELTVCTLSDFALKILSRRRTLAMIGASSRQRPSGASQMRALQVDQSFSIGHASVDTITTCNRDSDIRSV